MELWQIALPVADDADAHRVLDLLRRLRVPLDPCAGDPHFAPGGDGGRRLLVIVNARVRAALEDARRPFEIVRDLADRPDPRCFVSPRNRFAEELARLRATKGSR